MSGVIIRVPGRFPSTLSFAPLDAMDAPGVLLIHDYSNPTCLPAGPVAYEGSTTPTRLINLARNSSAYGIGGARDGLIVGNADFPVTRQANGLKLTNNPGYGAADYIKPAGNVSVLPEIATQDFLLTLWFTLNGEADWQGLLGMNQVGQAGERDKFTFRLSFGPGAQKLGQVWTGPTSGYGEQEVTMPTPRIGVPLQYAVHLAYSGGRSTLTNYLNGAVVNSANSDVAALANLPYPLTLGSASLGGNQSGITAHRLMLELTGASGRSPADVVKRDYDLHKSRFV